MLVHDFNAQLEYSMESSEDVLFDFFYHRAFPNLINIQFVTDLKTQKLGVDKILTFSSGSQVKIDEKKRRKNYDDILLELWSIYPKKQGWLYTSTSDYIVYAVMLTKKIYLLPTLLLKKAWNTNRTDWLREYPRWIDALNNGYKTRSKAIPTNVLLTAIAHEMEHSVIFSNGV